MKAIAIAGGVIAGVVGFILLAKYRTASAKIVAPPAPGPSLPLTGSQVDALLSEQPPSGPAPGQFIGPVLTAPSGAPINAPLPSSAPVESCPMGSHVDIISGRKGCYLN